MTVIGMLGAVSIVLGMTPLGFIPIGPTKATIMHIPVIIAAMIEGPLVGAIVGLIFGIFSMIQSITSPTVISFVFWNPLVSVFPRILIGIVSYYSYVSVKKIVKNEALAVAVTGAVGTLTNTVGVLSMIYLLYGVRFVEAIGQDINSVGKIIMGIGITNGIPEMIVAILIVTGVMRGLKFISK
ncbi:ECF transporter S component [Tepidibacter hydrothermalis]|uniref:ECF transporter S component n=2 Tax=Tepidibacter hydrothermalis TaxID=3036126 RepID=A0ABY8EKE8_9FIRM|nr:ECF transporter S component [Tepidibacter hydrothermalis]WFD12402.1 ECF transporter S component [Tepidibacter hydrothermalis]